MKFIFFTIVLFILNFFFARINPSQKTYVKRPNAEYRETLKRGRGYFFPLYSSINIDWFVKMRP